MNDVCFVIMPYGTKKDVDGKEVDFDEIYDCILKEAIESVDGFECVRCDDIERPGWIHDRMLRHIFEDRVAVVDTSTLNANVFYELGVRHALRKSVTVLVHREGTSWPFNMAGMNAIKYTTNPKGVKDAKEKIRKFIVNAIGDPKHKDSLVHHVFPDLRIHSGPAQGEKRLSKVEVFQFPLVRNADQKVAIVTGDREHMRVGDIWVSSENTDMQMDLVYGKSTSATIRYLGARRHPTSGKIVEDTIAKDLARRMGEERQVDPATVVPTVAGELEKNNVKWIFHVASVVGEPREGYRPIERIERCVTNALRKADDGEFKNDGLASILFPIFGTGPAGGDLEGHARRCIDAAIDYLESYPASTIKCVYFYAWSDVALDACRAVMAKHPRLKSE